MDKVRCMRCSKPGLYWFNRLAYCREHYPLPMLAMEPYRGPEERLQEENERLTAENAAMRRLLEVVQKRHDSLFAHDSETMALVMDIAAFLADHPPKE